MNSFNMVSRSFERQFAGLSEAHKRYVVNCGSGLIHGEHMPENFTFYNVPIWTTDDDQRCKLDLISVKTEIWD